MIEVGKRIRELRGKSSRREFAEAFLVAQSSLARWESGESPPELGFIIRLLGAYNIGLDWLVFGKSKSENEKLTADEQFAPLDGVDWVAAVYNKEALNEKNGQHVAHKKIQHTEKNDFYKNKMGDASPILHLTEQNAATQRELLEAVRQNGDLRVETERLRMDIERRDIRIAELERQLAEALKPQERPPVLGERSAAAG